MYFNLPIVGELHAFRTSALSSTRRPFILRDRDQHGSEYTLGAGRWQVYYTPASTTRRIYREAWQHQPGDSID